MKIEYDERHLNFSAWTIHPAGVDTIRFSPAAGALRDSVLVYEKHWHDQVFLKVDDSSETFWGRGKPLTCFQYDQNLYPSKQL